MARCCPLILEIVTVGEIPKDFIQKLAWEIKIAYSSVIEECLIGPDIGMPPAAYNKSRRQYDADMMLDRVLYRITDDSKVLVVLDVDLYTPSHDLNFIFGQAQLGGKVALVSLHRLNPKFYRKKEDDRLFLQRVIKEAVHEVGHALGLGHCTNTACVMCFSNNISDVDKKGPALCGICQGKLQRVLTIRDSR
ncbi:MAG: archaemetzincin family Zn-dependent metalloprotease [Candidatus Hadarchaeota archaeon]